MINGSPDQAVPGGRWHLRRLRPGRARCPGQRPASEPV